MAQIAAVFNTGFKFGGRNMAKVNYKFQKRQKELDRQKKQEEKQHRKQESKEPTDTEDAEAPLDGADTSE